MKADLSPTLEDYIGTIFHLQSEKQYARVRDISKSLDVVKSAVTVALQSLSEKGLVKYTPYEPVILTPEGKKLAEGIVLRRRIIEDFLRNILGIEQDRAVTIACGMEHAIDSEALERFVCFLAFVGNPQKGRPKLLSEFSRFVRNGAKDKTCKECIREYLDGLQSKNKEK
jgi:DtxR family Mn-dependent transcriptional regulator